MKLAPQYAHAARYCCCKLLLLSILQAFEECDLNHDGKLSYNEFRLWVERNPMVTHFLQSVFPYDEYRDWCGDSKHLPFIHNRDIASGGQRYAYTLTALE
jgi:EF hand